MTVLHPAINLILNQFHLSYEEVNVKLLVKSTDYCKMIVPRYRLTSFGRLVFCCCGPVDLELANLTVFATQH